MKKLLYWAIWLIGIQSGMKKLLYWAIWLIGITACVNPKGKEVLAEAERLMRTSPDSALLVLEQAKKEATTYSRRNRMHYLLLQAEAMNKAYLPLDTLTSMHEVLDYYLSHGNMAIGTSGCVPAT